MEAEAVQCTFFVDFLRCIQGFFRIHYHGAQFYSRAFSSTTRKLIEYLALTQACLMLLMLVLLHRQYIGKVGYCSVYRTVYSLRCSHKSIVSRKLFQHRTSRLGMTHKFFSYRYYPLYTHLSCITLDYWILVSRSFTASTIFRTNSISLFTTGLYESTFRRTSNN